MKRSKNQETKPRDIVRNMGLFWHRDKVCWAGNRGVGPASLKGLAQSREVDFWGQDGIYALYTSDYKLVYVGQSGSGEKSSIGDRLKSHNNDDLAGRWKLFSWFGLRRVTNKKQQYQLGTKLKTANTSAQTILNVLEGVLIEMAAPPMNKQKGRFGPSVERYIQSESEDKPEPRKEDTNIKDITEKLAKIDKKIDKKLQRILDKLSRPRKRRK